ncbi:MAG: ATP-binding cassette domain-containing protein, partial [Anaerolineales bacterium]
MSEVVLKAQGLSKRYGDLLAVDDLSIEVQRGEVFGFLGPNGAGKTTSINMICGLLEPDSGTVSIDGESIIRRDEALRTRLGVCPQDIVVWQRLTCR